VTLLVPEVCGPRLEVVKLAGLTANSSFVLPAFSYILNVASKKVSGSGGFALDLKLSGEDPFSSISVGGNVSPFTISTVSYNGFSLSDEEETVLIEAQSSWSGREVDLWFVIVRLEDE
jgi:hypothetical protein